MANSQNPLLVTIYKNIILIISFNINFGSLFVSLIPSVQYYNILYDSF